MEFFGVLLYLVPIFAVVAFLNALIRIARALESIAESLKTMEKGQDGVPLTNPSTPTTPLDDK